MKYFTPQRRVRSNTGIGTNGHLQTLPEERENMGSQPFSFPLYNGAAPSVPPRHLNQQQQQLQQQQQQLQQQQQRLNNIPSHESAFKRLEQQESNGLPQHIQHVQQQQVK